MRFAIPTADNLLCPHFGNCQKFAFIDVDFETGEITKIEMVEPPPHQPGMLPEWIKNNGSEVIIAGGMGRRALGILQNCGVKVISGAPIASPRELVNEYLNGRLQSGNNYCDSKGFRQAGGHNCKGHNHGGQF